MAYSKALYSDSVEASRVFARKGLRSAIEFFVKERVFDGHPFYIKFFTRRSNQGRLDMEFWARVTLPSLIPGDSVLWIHPRTGKTCFLWSLPLERHVSIMDAKTPFIAPLVQKTIEVFKKNPKELYNVPDVCKISSRVACDLLKYASKEFKNLRFIYSITKDLIH